MALSVVAVGLFLQIGRLAQISANALSISELRTTIERLEREQQDLHTMLTDKQNDRRISAEAERLEMRPAEAGQVRIVTMPDAYRAGEGIAASGADASDVSRE